MKRILFFITILVLCQYPTLFSQVKEPGLPSLPEIKTPDDLASRKFKARIAVQGRDELTEGEFVLNSDFLITRDNINISIKDISKINVLSWEKRNVVNRHSFYPSRYEILFNDNRKIIINGNIESLNRIKIGSRKSGYIYFYYYDYYKKGKWINSGVTDFNALISKPASGCAVSIELIQ